MLVLVWEVDQLSDWRLKIWLNKNRACTSVPVNILPTTASSQSSCASLSSFLSAVFEVILDLGRAASFVPSLATPLMLLVKYWFGFQVP